MKSVFIHRWWGNDKQMLGVLSVVESGRLLMHANSLERGWLNNALNISCIPAGSYTCVWTQSPRFTQLTGRPYFTYEILNVPGRSGIRMHSANLYSQLNGCIALGDALKDLNMDRLLDVMHSGNTMKAFEGLMSREDFVLTIFDVGEASMTAQPAFLRCERQKAVGEWALRCFGNISKDIAERVQRQLEEAIELAQAEGLSSESAHQLIDYVYSRPPGDPFQEVGGISITLLAYCEAKGFDADECETAELYRILSKSDEHFRQRQNDKADLGVAKKSI